MTQSSELQPSSITHLHLLALINTESQKLKQFRVLDVGCGTGAMLSYFGRAFPVLRPEAQIELHGMDVTSVGFDAIEGFFPTAPNIKIVHAGERWPYEEGYFDFIVSNQVLEHVKDADFFFSEVHRLLRDGGVSYHQFPLKACLWEGHLFMPLAHRCIEHDSQVAWIRAMQKIGFHRRNLDAERAADSLLYYTHYRSRSEILEIVKRADLRPAFRYTPQYYSAKLRSVLQLPARYTYQSRRAGLLTTSLLSRIASITLRAEKKNLHQ